MKQSKGQPSRVVVCDVGLTMIKTTVFEQDGRILAFREADNSAVNTLDDQSDMNLNQLWDIVSEMIRQLTAGIDGISGVGLSACGNGLYLVGSEGSPQYGITSLDQRGRALTDQWKKSGFEEEVFGITANHVWPGQPLPLLTHLRENAQLPEHGTLLFCKDWLRLRLTGALMTDRSDASAAGLLDRDTGNWAYPLFDRLGLGRITLPDLAESTAVTGTVHTEASRQTGLPLGTPVFGGGIDLALAAWADGLTEGVLHITAGTWSINQFQPTEPGSNQTAFLQSILPPQDGCPIWVDSSPSSGINLDFLRAVVGDGSEDLSDWGRLLDGYSPKSDDLIYLPYLAGAWDLPDHKAGLMQIRAGAQKEAFIVAVFEGIALGHVRQIRKFQKHTTVQHIVVCGGLTRSASWCQLLADYSGLPIEVGADPHSSSWGAALCCLRGLGVPLPERKTKRTIHKPSANRSGNVRYALFIQLLKSHEPRT